MLNSTLRLPVSFKAWQQFLTSLMGGPTSTSLQTLHSVGGFCHYSFLICSDSQVVSPLQHATSCCQCWSWYCVAPYWWPWKILLGCVIPQNLDENWHCCLLILFATCSTFPHSFLFLINSPLLQGISIPVRALSQSFGPQAPGSFRSFYYPNLICQDESCFIV